MRYIAPLLAMVVFCGVLATPAFSSSNEGITLQLKWKHAFQFAGFYMAQEKGFYDEQDLHVSLLEGGPGKNPVDYALGGAGHYGISDSGIILARADGKQVKALAAIFQHSPLALAVKESSGIRSFSDMKGKRAMMQAGNMDAVILAALKKNNINIDNFTRQETSFNLQDLIQDHTDAFSVYITDQPHQLKQMGVAHRLLLPGDAGIDFYGDVLITSDTEVRQHPARVNAFIEASLQGWDYALNHIDETIDVIVQKYNSQHLSRAQLYFEAHKTSEMVLKDVVTIGYMSPQRWQKIAATYAELELIKAGFPVSNLLYKAEPAWGDFVRQYRWQLTVFGLITLLLLFVLQITLLRRMVHHRTEALSESETRFRTLVANLPGVSYRCRPDEAWSMDFISDAIEGMSGYPAEDFIANRVRTFNSIIHPDDRVHVRKTVMAAAGEHRSYSLEYRMLRADGTSRWVHERGQPVFDRSGEMIWLDGNIFDVTEQKQAEQLSASTAVILEMVAGDKPLTDIFEAIILCYESRYPGMKGSILLLREGHLFLGAAPNLPDVYNAAIEGLEIGPMVGSCGSAAFDKKRMIVEDIEHDPRWAGYTELALPLNLRACWSEPVFSATGEVLGTFAMYYDHPCAPGEDEIRDISSAARLAGIAMERELNLATLKKLSRAIEQSGEVVTITNRDGVIEYINPAFTTVTGYSQQEAIGKIPRLLRSQRDQLIVSQIRAAMEQGESWHGRISEKKKDGSFYPAMLTISPIRDEGGKLSHYISVHEDLSQLQQLEDQFHQAQKMESIGTLVGGIAHDFNNILAAMQGNLYLAGQMLAQHSPIADKLNNVEQLGSRAADMIQQLLTFARKGIVSMQTVQLNDFIQEAYSLAGRTIPEDIESRCEICAEPLFVKADATQLQQILLNLLNNARSAVQGCASPCIDCRLDLYMADDAFKDAHPELKGDSFAHICVRDNGCGIPEAIREKIFEPFFTTKAVGEGTGLGLSMVYGAVQTHAGAIGVESEISVGTAFHLYLPLTTDMKSVTQGHDEGVITGHGESILLVDDDTNMREVTREVLESLNYRVTIAENGQQALALVSKRLHYFDVIITDIVMPMMNGDKMAHEIRQLNDSIPIIFCSGYDREQHFNTAEALPASLFLHKPFAIKKLSQSLHALLSL
ncbi:MAG: ABC transporter substrate-binding protein [Mariprofundus sp.]